MIDLIHIGDYKTGTTWWQKVAFPSHPDLYHLDNPDNHPEIVRLMHRLVDSRDLDFDPEDLRTDFSNEINSIQCRGKKKVICREALSGEYPCGDNAKRTAERLRSVFGEVKILIVIREQLSMLKAIYSQYVKIGGTLTLRSFVNDPIVSPGLIERLKYHKIINAYVEVFGKDNVFVGLFEDFKQDNLGFADRVFEFVGCSTEWAKPRKQIVENPSLKAYGVNLQRNINRLLRNDYNPRMPILPMDLVLGALLNDKRKQKIMAITSNRLIYSDPIRDKDVILRYGINFSLTMLIARLCEGIQFGPSLRVPDSIAEMLKSEFVDSNKVLHEEHGLPVQAFGWSL